MMAETLTRALAPLVVALMWFAAAVLIVRPGDGPGGPLAAGMLGGLALTIAAMVPSTQVPSGAARRARSARLRPRHVACLGAGMLVFAAAAAPSIGPTGTVRVLSLPSGGLAPAALFLTVLEFGVALVIAGLIGEAVAQLIAKRPGA